MKNEFLDSLNIQELTKFLEVISRDIIYSVLKSLAEVTNTRIEVSIPIVDLVVRRI